MSDRCVVLHVSRRNCNQALDSGQVPREVLAAIVLHADGKRLPELIAPLAELESDFRSELVDEKSACCRLVGADEKLQGALWLGVVKAAGVGWTYIGLDNCAFDLELGKQEADGQSISESLGER